MMAWRLCFLFLLAILNVFASDSIEVRFHFNGIDSKKVAVAGSFNNWDPSHFQLQRSNSEWELSIKLLPGYYYYKLVVDGKWIADPANDTKINDGGDGFNSIIMVGKPEKPIRKKKSTPFPKALFPQPLLAEDTNLVELYYEALKMCWNKIGRGNAENDFSEEYLDEGFNELIYQWDTSFMILFALYADWILPAMPSIDNFYRKQRADGYIQRVYWEKNGMPAAEPSKDEPMINPPLFPWIEWKYYYVTGDSSRLSKVLPILKKYFYWIDKNCRAEDGTGLYYTTPLGSGMDNTPRPGVNKAAWIDISLQMALAAKYIGIIAKCAGDSANVNTFNREYLRIKNAINNYCWDKGTGFYYDRRNDGSLSPVKHIGAYWALLSGVADSTQAQSLVDHLRNPSEFFTPHMVPTLSLDDPDFDAKGHYWRGGVWAPTNYMVIKGLEAKGFSKLADSITENHIRNVLEIFKDPGIAEAEITYEDRYQDGYHTIWECYSPVIRKPATRWDNTFLSRQDFVGWSGLTPIALLIENILGINICGQENKITWTLKRESRHGVENIRLQNRNVNLLYESDSSGSRIYVTAACPFVLKVNWRNKEMYFNIDKNNIPRTELKLN